ncbi:hypothetical protein ACJ41O_000581 [Fusarium nematophilum]
MDDSTVTHGMVDSTESISKLVESLQALPPGGGRGGPPNLFLDLEGVGLSRNGTVSILAVFSQPQRHVYLVDVHTLQSSAFDTPGPDGTTTLRDILESASVAKVFFDVRNDSDALHHHFGVRLQGIQDVQVMENASRPEFRRRWLRGLSRCITYDAPMSEEQKLQWTAVKDRGIELFHPDKGGSYEVFNERPLRSEVEMYCVNDVRFLPGLRDRYWGMLTPVWREKVEEEAARRVRESQSPDYEPQGADKRYGPWEIPR